MIIHGKILTGNQWCFDDLNMGDKINWEHPQEKPWFWPLFIWKKTDSARKTIVFTMEKQWLPVQCPLASPKILRCCLQSPSPRPFQSHPQASVSVLLTSLTWKKHINHPYIWLVVEAPLWKIWVRQLGLLFPIYGKMVPNHKPVMEPISCHIASNKKTY